MGLFENRRISSSFHKKQLPIWFMRQAGRYHSHYQKIKKHNDFISMCKNPELAAEITLGPVLEFDLDAAILFSDILFPLDHLGMGLRYDDHLGPTLNLKIKNTNDIKILEKNYLHTNTGNSTSYYQFQKDAIEIIKNRLPKHITLIGFVGAPFTLYAYAIEETLNRGRDLLEAKKGIYDGRYEQFNALLLPILLENIIIQINAGAEAIALFDTASGYLSFADYQQFLIPPLTNLLSTLKKDYPHIKIIYYSKYTTEDQLKALSNATISKTNISNLIDVMAIDFRFDLTSIYTNLIANNNHQYIQGNIDPMWLLLDWTTLKLKIDDLYTQITKQQSQQIHNSLSTFTFDRWIFGLGHGILKETPEENVKKIVKYVREKFTYS